ncbi:AraC family transcriptional regulator [Nocardioides sp. Root151]|uniref:AraC family transcriptional regulator n=1 Tax=Nocardioides sp. Root151 TaxID=1736475 RepID=UPI000702B00E|nr:AraC family transcriptional regulator [Nocardioides sp. Root151]KQZ75201.1 AraC family transcriptional regulator [Nocardioides sp. Root151]
MHPEVRAASLHGFTDLAKSVGLEPLALIDDAGLDVADLATPDTWIPARAAVGLLQSAALASGRDDFGLLLSERRRLSTLGPLSVVLREEPDVRSTLDLLMRYERNYNEALHLELHESGGLARLQISIELGVSAPTGQAVDLGVAALVGILRVFLDDDWSPLKVCFAHPAPDDLATHERLLGDRLQFDHEFSGVILTSTDLDRRNEHSDPTLRHYTQQLLANLPRARPEGAVERVRELIELLLPLGRCSVDQVARGLDVDRRTLNRHLAVHGETFTSLLYATRGRLAERHLANPRHSLTDISQLLGFAAPSGFSRWFRDQYGVAPREWRAQ